MSTWSVAPSTAQIARGPSSYTFRPGGFFREQILWNEMLVLIRSVPNKGLHYAWLLTLYPAGT